MSRRLAANIEADDRVADRALRDLVLSPPRSRSARTPASPRSGWGSGSRRCSPPRRRRSPSSSPARPPIARRALASAPVPRRRYRPVPGPRERRLGSAASSIVLPRLTGRQAQAVGGRTVVVGSRGIAGARDEPHGGGSGEHRDAAERGHEAPARPPASGPRARPAACAPGPERPREGLVVQDDALALDRPTRSSGRSAARRKPRPADQHGHDGNAALERARQLEAHVVAGLLEAGAALGRRGVEPVATDHRQHGVARVERAVDRDREVLARRDGADVLEDASRAQAGAQCVGEAPGVPAGVVAPVAEEDLHGPGAASHRPPGGQTGRNLVDRRVDRACRSA